MATDIIARGMAANAKKSVTELGNKIESEKWIGTKAEWEAVDKSTIKDGTIVYITDDETVILYDKAEMEKIAAQVAEDRTAAETAAQTAQSIADSLPEDYTTAVAKIAENTAEIGRVKLTDKELQRRVDALYDIGQGITHKFETDTDTAYQKTVPTGGKLMSVKNVGGRSIVFNQMIPDSIIHVTITIDEDIAEEKWLKQIVADTSPIAQAIGHKVAGKCIRDINNPSSYVTVRFGNNNVNVSNGSERYTTTENGIYTLSSGVGNPPPLYFRAFAGATAGTYKFTLQLFDLTATFGSGNEPSTVEEFEAMFPNDYYQYNAGEIISAGTEEIVEQGANLCDPTIFSTAYPEFITVKDNIIDVFSGGQAMFGTGVALKIPQGYSMTFTPMSKGNMATNGRIRALFSDGDSSDIAYITDGNSLLKSTTNYVVKKDISAIAFNWSDLKSGYAFKMQITQNATDSFTPYHRNTYPIPEAIKALPGYGWSAGTAKNYVDYENKRYVQCVGSVDSGTLNWWAMNGYDNSFGATIGGKNGGHNMLCDKYIIDPVALANIHDKSMTANRADSNVYVKDTAYTDATAFKQAMQGVILYYELANPIVTDISSLIPDDFLRNLTVEAGGSVTFKNSNGDNYRIPVPSEEEYIVKLSEVGGTT